MSIISLPEPATTNPVFATLAEYAARFEIDHGGSHLRTVLLAALIADKHHVAPGEAIDLARDDAFDDRVRSAGREADRLMGEARRRWEAADAPETMQVRVRDRSAEAPWGYGLTSPVVRTVEISTRCPRCGGERGKPTNLNQVDDGAYYSVDIWTNPCGHVDFYEDVVKEAASREGADQ